MLLDKHRLNPLAGFLNLIAISLDGRPETHNKMRNNPQAFQKMESQIRHLKDLEIPFGFIFTLTLHNLNELPWVAKFVAETGAQQLQIHALEEAGNAQLKMAGCRPDKSELGYAFVVALQLQKIYADQLAVQLDAVTSRMISDNADRFFGNETDHFDEMTPLSQVVEPLVIEADGSVVPLQYGINRAYKIGNLYDNNLSALGAQWKKEGMASFHLLCKKAFKMATKSISEGEFFGNYYDLIQQISNKHDV